MKRHIFAAAFGALLVFLPVRHALHADAALYTIEDLGLIDNVAPTVTGMNAAGQLSGYVTQPSGLPRAVRYTPAGGWQYLTGVSTFLSAATGINDNGVLVGYQHDGSSFRAFRYTQGSAPVFIEPLPGGSMSFGLAIDNNGTVVGQSDSTDGTFGFRAAPGDTAVAIPSVMRACGINAAGQIVGYGANADGGLQGARLETNGAVTPIVSFDGPFGTTESCALDAAGRVGGRATSDNNFRAFTFESGSPVNVDTFASSESKVESVAAGVAVGWFVNAADGVNHAFVNAAGASFDLNDLIASGSGWQLDQAFAVNESGTIVGVGRFNGEARAFRLTRVEASDTTAPVISAVSASPSTIEPPNNGMVTVTVSVSATDDKDASPVCSVSGIDGHGAPATDYSVVGPLTGWVRARGGATYSFAVTCTDASGNVSPATSVDVVVPADTTRPVINSVTVNPSTVWPPNGALVPVTVSVNATDNVDASPVCSLSSISAVPSAGPDDYLTTGPLSAKVRAVGGRTYTLVVTCRDTAGNTASAAVAVCVPADTKAPVIGSVMASPGTIWPPNGKMVNVTVFVSATDNVDASPQCAVSGVTANGGTAADAVVTGPTTASVRADKNANNTDRIYTLKVTCRDAAGNTSNGSTTVVVTKDAPSAKNVASAKAILAHLLKKAAATKAAANAHRHYFSRGSSR